MPPIDDKLIAPIELPASPVVIDPSEVHSGAADVERLASAISGFVRRVNPGLEKLAEAVSPDEESLVVAVSGQAALLVTNRRLIVANAEGVQSINRADVLTVDRAGRLGGVKVETRGHGELAWSSLRPNKVDEDIRALLAEPVELAEQPAELPSAAKAPETPAIAASAAGRDRADPPPRRAARCRGADRGGVCLKEGRASAARLRIRPRRPPATRRYGDEEDLLPDDQLRGGLGSDADDEWAALVAVVRFNLAGRLAELNGLSRRHVTAASSAPWPPEAHLLPVSVGSNEKPGHRP